MFVSCCLAMNHQGSREKPLNALTVAAALYFSINLAGSLSGGSLNPAVGLVQSIFQNRYSNTDHPEDIDVTKMGAIHVLGPLVGGILAAPVHKILTYCKDRMEENEVTEVMIPRTDLKQDHEMVDVKPRWKTVVTENLDEL